MKNIFYFRNISEIGGIETFLYYLSKEYSDYDITIFYNNADKKQLERLKEYVRCIKFRGQEIECEKAFFNYNLDIIDNVKAKEYYQIIHGDYKAIKVKPNTNEKITKYLGVSQLVCDTFKELTGMEAECIYNPVKIDKPKKILRLISATRLTGEKGLKRIETLANKLNADKIPFEWQIFTTNTNINIDNVIVRKSRLNVLDYIAQSDYLVQLSDSEGYCYSLVEALSLNVPVICTDMPVLKEIGINENNAYILDMNMSNIDTDKIYNNIPKVVDYKPPKCSLINYIDKTKSNYEEKRKMKYLVEALDTYKRRNLKDAILNKVPEEGEQFEVSKERLDILLGDNNYNEAFVKVVKEIKEEVIETATKEVKAEKAIKRTTKKAK